MNDYLYSASTHVLYRYSGTIYPQHSSDIRQLTLIIEPTVCEYALPQIYKMNLAW